MLWRCGMTIKDCPSDCCEDVRLIYDAKRLSSIHSESQRERPLSFSFTIILFHQAKKCDQKSSQCCDRLEICRGLHVYLGEKTILKKIEFSKRKDSLDCSRFLILWQKVKPKPLFPYRKYTCSSA